MANPTNPFNWQMPTSTDLVTDLPADFETFGQAVATSMADLLGGTTGQVLSKASNTNMDFTWVTSDDANAIQNAIVDAKGDLIAASANDTPARLAVGANGETLVADSSTSTGLRYTAGTVQANPVLNSSFQVWQRGTSISNFGFFTLYTADRWSFLSVNSGRTISRQLTNDTTNLPFIQYCARVQRDSGNTDTTYMQFANGFETINTIPFKGKTITFSFYARKGANYSQSADKLRARIITGTGTDQNVNSGGYTGAVDLLDFDATLTSTWQRFQGTVSVPTTVNEMATAFTAYPTGTAGANDWFEVTGVQVDIGSVALPFRTNQPTFATELAACQRYYYDSRDGSNQPFSGYSNSTDYLLANVRYPVTMRTAPSVTIGQASGSNYVRRISTNAQIAITVTSYPGTNVGGFSAVYAAAAPFVAAVGYDFYVLASAEL
jgi:hypothetical protein